MKTFRYDCGCFMMIDKHGCGGGKNCDLCKGKQKFDNEEYTGLKFIYATPQEVKESTTKTIEQYSDVLNNLSKR